jgi:hypothetical protein
MAPMKAATFVLLLAFSSAVMGTQTRVPSGDVTIKMSEGAPEYCVAPIPVPPILQTYGFFKSQSPDDMTLQLPLKLHYENHRSGTIFLGPETGIFTRITVIAQNGPPIILRRAHRSSGVDVKAVMAMPRLDMAFDPIVFSTLAGRKDQSSTMPAWAQCLSGTEPGCISERVVIPVVDRSSGLDLRGKTVEIMTTRDHPLAPEVVQRLNELWKDNGTVWAGVVESEPLTFRIPEEPLARDCRLTLPK